MPQPQKIRLGDALISQGLINEDQLKEALNQQRQTGRKLGRVVQHRRALVGGRSRWLD